MTDHVQFEFQNFKHFKKDFSNIFTLLAPNNVTESTPTKAKCSNLLDSTAKRHQFWSLAIHLSTGRENGHL